MKSSVTNKYGEIQDQYKEVFYTLLWNLWPWCNGHIFWKTNSWRLGLPLTSYDFYHFWSQGTYPQCLLLESSRGRSQSITFLFLFWASWMPPFEYCRLHNPDKMGPWSDLQGFLFQGTGIHLIHCLNNESYVIHIQNWLPLLFYRITFIAYFIFRNNYQVIPFSWIGFLP